MGRRMEGKRMLTEIVNERIVQGQPPFASCHGSHLALLANGDVLAVWFGGSREGEDDTAIWCARRTNGRWGAVHRLAGDGSEPHWNPVLLSKGNGEVLLFYKVGRSIKEWRTMVKRSSDDGRTWTEAEELVPGDRGGRGPVRNKVIVLSEGAWLAPASLEDGVWRAFADRSEDGGRHWEKSAEVCVPGSEQWDIRKVDSDIPVSEQSFYGRGVIQPTLWESAPGKVHMLLRSSEGWIHRSDSEDGGRTWTHAYPTSLPNNNSGIDVVRMHDGTLILCYNPVGQNWGPRTPLALSFSRDNGQTWSAPRILEDGEGEFSYPAIIADGHDVYLTYTWKRENIAFRRFRYSP